MGRDWQIGDPVDYTSDGWMDAQNWGHHRRDEKSPRYSEDYSQRDYYSEKAWDYYFNAKYEDALKYINMALDLDNMHPDNWDLKANILEFLERYRESEECYNRSLELSPKDSVFDNKSRMLRTWASQLAEESKDLPDGRQKLKKAEELIKKAINARPGEKSKEYLSRYLATWDKINFLKGYESDYQRGLNTLKEYKKRNYSQ